MCKTKPIDFNLLKATAVPSLMKDFPKCGIRFKTDGEYGLVLVHPDVRNQQLVKDKIAAARIKASEKVFVVDIPRIVIDVFNIRFIPTLTQVVA